MPIYDYRCQECSAIYDVLHKGKELSEDIQCPHCGSQRHIKLISLPGIIAKGESSFPCDQGMCGMEKSCCGGMCHHG
jgi:putative FmdB family regulatory protein